MSELKVVDLAARRAKEEDEEHAELIKDMKELCDCLMKAAEEDRLEQLVIQWEETKPEEEVEEGEADTTTKLLHFNRNYDLDQSLGYAERLKQRIFLITEGIIEGD